MSKQRKKQKREKYKEGGGRERESRKLLTLINLFTVFREKKLKQIENKPLIFKFELNDIPSHRKKKKTEINKNIKFFQCFSRASFDARYIFPFVITHRKKKKFQSRKVWRNKSELKRSIERRGREEGGGGRKVGPKIHVKFQRELINRNFHFLSDRILLSPPLPISPRFSYRTNFLSIVIRRTVLFIGINQKSKMKKKKNKNWESL